MHVRAEPQANLKRAASLVHLAADKGARIVCLPELFETPYFPASEHSVLTPKRIPNASTRLLCAAARDEGVVLVAGSVYEEEGGRAYNTSLVISEKGKVLGRYRKVHLPEDPGFYEQRYFSPGDSYLVCKTSVGNVAVLICFDQWYPEAARAVKLMGAELLFYPTAIGTVRGIEQAEGDWRSAWEAVQRGHAVANSLVVAAVNRAGREGDTRFWGGSFVYDQFGTLVARARGGEQVLMAACDLDLGRDVERGWGFERNRKPRTYGILVK